MTTAAQADVVARLLERLLADPAFRARFRRDPAGTCRAAGLHELAEELVPGDGRALHTLDLRESRSSLAGVLMAAALEGVAVVELLRDPPPAIGDVLSRVDLSAVPEALRAAEAQAADAPAPRGEEPRGAPRERAGDDEPRRVRRERDDDDGVPRRKRDDGDDEPRRAREPSPAPASVQEAAPAEASTRSYDPAQFGAEGTGGRPSPEARALLDNDRVIFDDVGRADLRAGRIDPRVIAVLTQLSEEHEITVSCMCSDHSKLTSGGSISNHWYGRGVDIAAIDGQPVNPANPDARELATDLQELSQRFRPDEVGTPWPINSPGYFTDAAHQDHLHLGFKQPLPTGWQPPTDLTAQPADPQPTPADTTPPTPADSLQLPALEATTDQQDSLTHLPAAREQPAEQRPEKVSAGAAVRGAVETPGTEADGAAQLAAADGAEDGDSAAAGARALAALAEVKKHLGTPYRWGGSTPETGFDCSGLVQWAYAKAGIQIPRVTYDQVDAPGADRVERADLRPGDLVFFQDPAGSVYHVGMSLGGDRFIHAPRTGDVVKEASLDTPYFGQRFAGGRRFDDAPAADAPVKASAPDPQAVADAEEAVVRDAAEAGREDSALFFAISEQEATNHRESLALLPAVEAPGRPAAPTPAAPDPGEPPPDLAGVPTDYPGDDAPPAERARWLAKQVERHGLPPELPVMAALVESGMKNLDGGHADSVGFFQMRVGIWNTGAYAGYPDRPELQVRWFVDQALAVKRRRLAQGLPVDDPRHFGEWIADVERPAEQYRGRYQLRLREAQRLLR